MPDERRTPLVCYRSSLPLGDSEEEGREQMKIQMCADVIVTQAGLLLTEKGTGTNYDTTSVNESMERSKSQTVTIISHNLVPFPWQYEAHSSHFHERDVVG